MSPSKRSWIGMMVLAASPACGPLRQPLGNLEPRSDGSPSTPDARDGATADLAPLDTGPKVPTGTQIPSLPLEWGNCTTSAFRCFRDPAVPASPPVGDSFSGPLDPVAANKPVLAYPLAASTHPINLADITFQWSRGPGDVQSVFRIRLKRGNGDAFEFYVPCNHTDGSSRPDGTPKCIYHLPPGAWLDLATRARGEAVTVDVAGVNATGEVATSSPTALSFSPEYVSGGLYYWSNDLPGPGTARLLFGARKALPFITRNSESNPYDCSGCHVVSRGGDVIAFTAGVSATGSLRVEHTADPGVALFTQAAQHDSATMALNHDGTRVLVSVSGRLLLRDTSNGSTLLEVNETLLGRTMHGFHPEWSPDDSAVAITLSAEGDSDWAVRSGAIAVIPYNNGAFQPVETLVPSTTDFNFYPTWSPDGHWIAFSTAPVGLNQTSYDQPNARLRLVNRDTRQVYELKAATAGLGRTASWPKFTPAAQAGGLMFLTFNSKIDYGYIVENNASGVPQLWVTSIDVRKAQTPDDDPSSAPVWLPFQDFTKRNYLGTWAERVGCRVAAGGQSIGCGEAEECLNGACAMVVP
jgi:hypothetical protein